MLGIIFTGGECPSKEKVIKTLEGKEALIVAADSGLHCAEDARIKPDIIIGDMDSVDNTLLANYPAESVIRHPADKDYTDTELAMQLAQDKGCDEIWIIGGGGGRLDHLLGIRALFEREIFPSRWITDKEDIYCIENNSITHRKCDYSLISVFPLGNGPWKAASTGLKWELDNVKWSRGFFGLSNVAVEGKFSITAEQGRFLIIILNHERHEPHEHTNRNLISSS